MILHRSRTDPAQDHTCVIVCDCFKNDFSEAVKLRSQLWPFVWPGALGGSLTDCKLQSPHGRRYTVITQL